MTTPFRFGVVAPLLSDLPPWRDRVRRIADCGYSTLLVPDFPLTQPAPGAMLATAAAPTDLRVGTWVYASPLRPAWMTAWEAHSLSVLTGGRFEMGIGPDNRHVRMDSRDQLCASCQRQKSKSVERLHPERPVSLDIVLPSRRAVVPDCGRSAGCRTCQRGNRLRNRSTCNVCPRINPVSISVGYAVSSS